MRIWVIRTYRTHGKEKGWMRIENRHFLARAQPVLKHTGIMVTDRRPDMPLRFVWSMSYSAGTAEYSEAAIRPDSSHSAQRQSWAENSGSIKVRMYFGECTGGLSGTSPCVSFSKN